MFYMEDIGKMDDLLKVLTQRVGQNYPNVFKIHTNIYEGNYNQNNSVNWYDDVTLINYSCLMTLYVKTMSNKVARC